MKIFSVVFLAVLSFQASAAETLKCKSADGSKLEWTKSYGELVATDSRGDSIADMDALGIGRTRTVNGITITDIIYADESDYMVYAKIVKSPRGTSIVLENKSYYCK